MAGTLQYKLALDNSQFTTAMAGAQKAIGAGLVGVAAAVAGAGLTIAGAMLGIKNAIQLGGELSDLSAQTGETAGDILVLREAFMDAGLGAAALPQSLGVLSKALSGVSESGESTKDVFARLGLDIGKLRGMGAAQQFETIGQAINKLPNQADKAAASMKIFGQSGSSMLRLFSDPKAFETARTSLGSMPDVVNATNAQFDKIGDSFGRLTTKINGLWMGILVAFIPVMERISGWLDSIDLAGIGMKIGALLSTIAEMFGDGSLGELLSAALIAGFQHAVNFLAQSLSAALGGLAGWIMNLPRLWWEELKMLASPGLWKGMADVAIGAFEALGSALLRIFNAPLAHLGAGIDMIVQGLFNALSNIPGLGHLRQPHESYRQAVERRKDEFTGRAGAAAADGGARMQRGWESIQAAGAEFGKALQDAFADVKTYAVSGWETGKVFEDTAAMARLDQALAGIQERLAGKIREALAAGADAGKGAEQAGGGVGVKGAAPKIFTDRLARMGGFIGGVVNDPARRSATAAEKQVSLLQQILRVQRGHNLAAYYT